MFGRKNEDFCCHVVDSATGIEYASRYDLMQAARVRMDDNTAKNVAIKELEKEVDDSKKQVSSLTKEVAELKKKNVSYTKELELMYLQAIGNAKTVKQVEAVLKKYHSSSIRPTMYEAGLIGNMRRFAEAVTGYRPDYPIRSAAATKIKRLNRELVIKKCRGLEQEADATVYAMVMMALLKEVTGKEVDGTKIIEAKKADLDPLSVFLSMLSAYNIKQDEVM